MKTTIVCLFFLLPFLSGCAPQPLFYWGNYSETLYDYKKNPDQKTLDAHKKSLQDILDESPKKNRQVPPGVYAEYGYILLKEGKDQDGLRYLDKEQAVYPESRLFIQRIKDENQRGKK
jgi:hypothetical protein